MSVSITVRYQETDRMGIAHHASYFGWLEVARTEFLRRQGLRYLDMERMGVLLPVVEARCRYEKAVDYDTQVDITVNVSLRGARVEFNYVLSVAGTRIGRAVTTHAWADGTGRARNPVHHQPELWRQLREVADPD